MFPNNIKTFDLSLAEILVENLHLKLAVIFIQTLPKLYFFHDFFLSHNSLVFHFCEVQDGHVLSLYFAGLLS